MNSVTPDPDNYFTPSLELRRDLLKRAEVTLSEARALGAFLDEISSWQTPAYSPASMDLLRRFRGATNDEAG